MQSENVLRHKEFIQMIRNDISTFLNTKNQDGRPNVLIMLNDLLKKRKYEVTISLLNLKCIFWAKPMESSNYFWITNI